MMICQNEFWFLQISIMICQIIMMICQIEFWFRQISMMICRNGFCFGGRDSAVIPLAAEE